MFENGFPKEWSTLRKLAWLYRTVINAVSAVLKTIIGNPIHITDALAKPAQSLSVKLEPIQDLHGYDNPWPAGGGKNKFDKDTLSQASEYDNLASGYRYCDPIVLKPNTQYTINPTSTQGLGVTDYYVLYINPDESDTDYLVITNPSIRYVVAAGTPQQITFKTGQTGVIRFGVVLQGSGIKTTALEAFMTINYQLEEGSTATAWTPYSNICPISGHTDADVTRTGKNLCDSAAFESGLLAAAIGSDINAVTSTTRYAHSGIMPAQAALAVTVKTLDLTKIDYASVVAYVGDKVAWTAAQAFSSSVMSKSWTIPANTYEKLRINIGAPSGVVADVANCEVQVELGSATAYEPYVGATYPIPLGTTVYGGTLDVVNGKMYARPYYPSYNGETLVGPWVSSMDKYEEGATPTTGAQVVDMGGTVTEISLTPEEITLLEGENNLWSDAGNMTLTYYADGNASEIEALNILLGNRYYNNHEADEPTDREALQILLGGQR